MINILSIIILVLGLFLSCQHLSPRANLRECEDQSWFRFKQFLCFVLIDVRCFRVPLSPKMSPRTPEGTHTPGWRPLFWRSLSGGQAGWSLISSCLNLYVCYSVHYMPPLDPIQKCEFNPHSRCFFKAYFNFILPSTHCSPEWLLRVRFSNRNSIWITNHWKIMFQSLQLNRKLCIAFSP
jgi:hypothetical protein